MGGNSEAEAPAEEPAAMLPEPAALQRKPSTVTILSMKVRPEAVFSKLLRSLGAGVVVAVYFALGCIFYMHMERDWTLVDCIYFQMVTVSTVGYGDFSPSDDSKNPGLVRGFTIVWILVGILVVFTNLAKAVSFITRPILNVTRRFLVTLMPHEGIDINGDGQHDFYVPGHPFIYYPQELLAPVLLAVVVQVSAACAFMHFEGWDFGTAFYHCMVTATTVGYGDVSIETDSGKVVAIVHIMFSVAIIAMLISEIDGAAKRRAHALEKLRLIRAKLDPDLICSLDQDGNGVCKLEFVIGMIVKLELLEWSDVEPFMKQFDQLDTDKSGMLDKEDLERAAELTAARLGRDRAITLQRPDPSIRRAAAKLSRKVASKVVHNVEDILFHQSFHRSGSVRSRKDEPGADEQPASSEPTRRAPDAPTTWREARALSSSRI